MTGVSLRATTAAAIAAMVALLAPAIASAQVPAQVAAKSGVRAPSDSDARALSQDLIRTLQSIRPLDGPPPVSEVVQATTTDGHVKRVPVSASLALWDLNPWYGYQGQLQSVFPRSRADYPLDSLTQVVRLRAAAWVNRLSALPASEQSYAVLGWQRVPFAKVAALAANDSLAQRLFDTRIAELASNPVEQSEVLYEAVTTFADGPAQDTARLARNLVTAERYLRRLRALRTSGFPLQHDTATILYHQWRAEDSLMISYGAIGDTVQLFAHARALLPFAVVLGVNERQGIIAHAYSRPFHALMHTERGRAQLTAFQPTVLAMAHRAEVELPANATAEQRARVQGIESGTRQWMKEIADWLALLNTPAPPISAHVWLNTPDSLYQAVPRTRTFADGRVHVIAFGSQYEPFNFPVLERVQRRFPSGVDVLMVAQTNGTTGPDIAGPREETEWVTRYLRGIRHFTFPIALWAGSKRQSGFVPEGHYPTFDPEPSPNGEPYSDRMLGNRVVIVDTHGIMRFFSPVDTRQDEIVLWARVQQLLNASAVAGASAPQSNATPTHSSSAPDTHATP